MESREKVAAGLILAAMMSTAGLITYVWANPEPIGPNGTGGLLSTFSSEDQMFDFLSSSGRSGVSYNDSSQDAGTGSNEKSSYSPSYSHTNVQVAGVDEMDSVKTDGKYIYVASYDSVSILNAYPPTSLKNESIINESYILGEDDPLVDLSFSGVFVLPHRLVVIGTWYEYQYNPYPVRYDSNDTSKQVTLIGAGVMAPIYNFVPKTYAFVFDTSDPANPRLDSSIGVSGNIQTARMIDGRVYVIAEQYQWMIQDENIGPRSWVGEDSTPLDLDSIYYDPGMRDASSFLNVLALDVLTEEYESVSIVAGYASTIYMTHEAIFLSVQKWTGDITVMADGLAVEGSSQITTTIFKLAFEGLSMKAVARGDVDGWLLNQFSLDEKDDYLRVATTNMWFQPTEGTDMSNSVYVLNSSLGIVGSLTGIAPTERIYSARFVGDTLYLVTFRQIDPLFVIDLRDPTEPRIVGELEMPGFSSYLHPVDATHLLGIGSENNRVKVSLYDVSDPSAPVEQSKFLLDEYNYSWSDATYDHKAVVFDLEKGILVIPISAYGDYIWEYGGSSYIVGALVLNISLDDGISLRGIVQQDSDAQYGSEYVFRSVYIGDYLYTISYTMVKASLLSDLSEVSSLVYKSYEYRYYYAL